MRPFGAIDGDVIQLAARGAKLAAGDDGAFAVELYQLTNVETKARSSVSSLRFDEVQCKT